MVEGRLALELPFLMLRAPRALPPRALPRLDKLLPLALPPGGEQALLQLLLLVI